ncbi:hypothetical protein [Mycoplasma miroungirhinis]|uniref:Lipoprotein n=1 Tax=Mycoplasma miroungirhinis TaxID=754516 RepID=A0A6M4JCV1_9MOLU|nr:hypothetical protein [Mycoplasma miroungirhinis]QJR43866.1 hypothetical protein HLA92_00065 [Mycoplasma miroungirhinis]
MKLKNKWILPITFAAAIVVVTIPLIATSCTFTIKKTDHSKDKIKTSKHEFIRLFESNQNNFYVKYKGSEYEADAKQNNQVDVTKNYELLKKFVTIEDIEKYGRNYAWKWYFKDKGQKQVEFYLYSVPIEALAKQDPYFIETENSVFGDWSKIVDKNTQRPLKKFTMTLNFDEI